MSLRFRYDPEADAAYLRLSTAAVIDSEEVSPGVVLDYGADGRIVGFEVLQAGKRLPDDVLIQRE